MLSHIYFKALVYATLSWLFLFRILQLNTDCHWEWTEQSLKKYFLSPYYGELFHFSPISDICFLNSWGPSSKLWKGEGGQACDIPFDQQKAPTASSAAVKKGGRFDLGFMELALHRLNTILSKKPCLLFAGPEVPGFCQCVYVSEEVME
jgi:hypothetical protein